MTGRVTLGGPDYPSIKFLRAWPSGFYISPLVDNFDGELQRFLTEQYFKNGAALFGRESPEEMQAVRDWARGYLDDASDATVYEIVQYFVQRVRNYVHIESLEAAQINYAIIADYKCAHSRSVVDVLAAAARLRLFKKLTLLEYEEQVWGRDHGFPPYDLGCGCRLEGFVY